MNNKLKNLFKAIGMFLIAITTVVILQYILYFILNLFKNYIWAEIITSSLLFIFIFWLILEKTQK